MLPVVGLGLCLVGGAQVMQSNADGWMLLAFGGSAIVLDILIDLVWAHPGVSESDQPDLNRRDLQLVGRTALVAEAIEHGRGKVKIGDTLWPVEGPEAPVGTVVRVTGASGAVLKVEFVIGEAS